jgi:hypothetical protein
VALCPQRERGDRYGLLASPWWEMGVGAHAPALFFLPENPKNRRYSGSRDYPEARQTRSCEVVFGPSAPNWPSGRQNPFSWQNPFLRENPF